MFNKEAYVHLGEQFFVDEIVRLICDELPFWM
jgi:hypothetical protein